jgi:hypothetical protein
MGQGFVIRGAEGDDRSGVSVSSAGDVNGDGFADLIVATDHGFDATLGATVRGETYVLFGHAGVFSPALDLKALTPSQGVRLDGGGAIGDVAAAGDVNGDGFDDIVIGAPDGDGSAYVVYGGSFGLGSAQARLELGTASDDVLTAGDDGDILMGGLGNDTLDAGIAGRVILNGGAGNDVLAMPSVGDGAQVHGGSGFDTLRVSSDLDLSALNAARGYDVIDGIEQIDLKDDAAQTLTLDYLDFTHLSDEKVDTVDAAQTLLILGDAADTVHMGDGWTQIGSQTVDGTLFDLYGHDYTPGDPAPMVIGIDHDIGNVLP